MGTIPKVPVTRKGDPNGSPFYLYLVYYLTNVTVPDFAINLLSFN